jgi:hypothetical protein
MIVENKQNEMDNDIKRKIIFIGQSSSNNIHPWFV